MRFGPDVLGLGFLETAESGRLRRLMAAAGRGLVFSGRAAREVGERMVGLAAAASLERLRGRTPPGMAAHGGAWRATAEIFRPSIAVE